MTQLPGTILVGSLAAALGQAAGGTVGRARLGVQGGGVCPFPISYPPRRVRVGCYSNVAQSSANDPAAIFPAGSYVPITAPLVETLPSTSFSPRGWRPPRTGVFPDPMTRAGPAGLTAMALGAAFRRCRPPIPRPSTGGRRCGRRHASPGLLSRWIDSGQAAHVTRCARTRRAAGAPHSVFPRCLGEVRRVGHESKAIDVEDPQPVRTG